MLNELKEKVWQANIDLKNYNLVALTWGNVSGIDRKAGLVAIKPSGISYKELKPSQIVLVNMEGEIVEGELNPSSDTATHLELYMAFEKISAVTHVHSEYASMFAQAFKEIPCLGTTHADHFYGSVPCSRLITQEEVEEDYEKNTGKVIIERFKEIDPMEMPAILVAGHGAFVWGKSPDDAVKNSVALEKIAKMAWGTFKLNPRQDLFPDYILRKHYHRKHGPKAYYGQKKGADNEKE